MFVNFEPNYRMELWNEQINEHQMAQSSHARLRSLPTHNMCKLFKCSNMLALGDVIWEKMTSSVNCAHGDRRRLSSHYLFCRARTSESIDCIFVTSPNERQINKYNHILNIHTRSLPIETVTTNTNEHDGGKYRPTSATHTLCTAYTASPLWTEFVRRCH